MTIKSSSAAQPQVAPDRLPLQRLYYWEREARERIYMTQPFDGGKLRHYTWRETADQARRIAAYLQEQNWPAGSRIAILGKNSAAWLIADMAIWMAGHVSVPIYPLLAAHNVEQIIVHSNTLACFIGKLDDTALLAGVPGRLLTIALPLAPDAVIQRCSMKWDDIIRSTQPVAGYPVRDGSDLATIMYTSGTTGQSKGVMHSFDTLTAGCLNMIGDLKISPTDRVISYLPLAHIAERTYIEMGTLQGGPQVFFAESLTTFLADIQRARPTFFGSVPRLWLKFQQGVLAKMPAERLAHVLKLPFIGWFVRRKVLKSLGMDAVRIALTGAAPTPAAVMQWYADIGLPLSECFGMTEISVTHSTISGGNRIGTVGMPVDNVQHRINPEDGELQILTAGATLGYYLAPDLSAALFTADGWLRTGDKGVIDADNRLRIVGRIKDNFKSSKGKYIAPGPIEDKLAQHPMAEACLVMGANLAQPLAVLVLNETTLTTLPSGKTDIEASFTQHLARINRQLDPHEQLTHVVLSTTPWTPENGMLTPTLKARRQQIENHFANRLDSWIESRQSVIWSD